MQQPGYQRELQRVPLQRKHCNGCGGGDGVLDPIAQRVVLLVYTLSAASASPMLAQPGHGVHALHVRDSFNTKHTQD